MGLEMRISKKKALHASGIIIHVIWLDEVEKRYMINIIVTSNNPIYFLRVFK